MKAIVNVDKNWAIGSNGDLLLFIPEDMKFFKEKTLGKVVVMGRTTFESLPGRKPLKDRINIVMSKSKDFEAKGIIICNNISDVLEELKKYDDDEIFVIGGESIYKQFLDMCDEIYVTKNTSEKDADKYFPNLDDDPNWFLIEKSDKKNHENIEYEFTLYKKNFKN